MHVNEGRNIAKRLYETHGMKAEAEAARKVQEAEQSGDPEQMELWRRVRAATHEMKAAHES